MGHLGTDISLHDHTSLTVCDDEYPPGNKLASKTLHNKAFWSGVPQGSSYYGQKSVILRAVGSLPTKPPLVLWAFVPERLVSLPPIPLPSFFFGRFEQGEGRRVLDIHTTSLINLSLVPTFRPLSNNTRYLGVAFILTFPFKPFKSICQIRAPLSMAYIYSLFIRPPSRPTASNALAG